METEVDLTLRVYDSQGRVIVGSNIGDLADDGVTMDVEAGVYYIGVSALRGTGSYRLEVAVEE